MQVSTTIKPDDNALVTHIIVDNPPYLGIQDNWGGPYSTHITFRLKGDARNRATTGMQVYMGGAETDNWSFVGIWGQFDMQNEEWQEITVTPVNPGWDVEQGWWGLSWNPFDNDATEAYTVYYSIDDVVLVPEPAAMLLFGLGGLFIRRRK